MKKLRFGSCSGLVFGLVVALPATLGATAGGAEKVDRGERAAKASPAPAQPAVPQVVRPARSGSSLAVRDIPRVTKVPDPNKVREIENDPGRESARPKSVDTGSLDGALQSTMPASEAPAPIVNFQGISQLTQAQVSGGFVLPPDTVGDVGPNHYVQCVNLACQVFNKSGTAAAGPFTLSSLFAPLGGACATTNDGDPIVLYDPLAGRWHLSQFALPSFPDPPFSECVAVSQTGDPTGAYHLYEFLVPGGYLNDYPKFGVWPDGYYMTAPLFAGPQLFFAGEGVFVMNRAKMLVGDPTAEMVFFDLTGSHPGLGPLLPADLDGVPPPPGTPNYMASITADEFGDAQDGIRLFEVRPDFGNPAASTFTELPPLSVASYDPTFTESSGTCSGFAFNSRDDIDQPPPANCGQRVDSIADRPLHRLAYRNFGGHESLVFSHAADVNATPPSTTSGHVAGVRYYELRRALPGGSFAVIEQATFSPDTTHRWMSSAAIDAQGNIAVGYSVSDVATTFPGVRYAGRLASDPSGGLFQGEATLATGGRVQTDTRSRWGDYSAMSVDPADECTFWYTQEYYDAVAPPGCFVTACWQTRIGSFKFPTCMSSTAFGTLQGTVTNAATSTPLSGALVQANGYSALTNVSGVYSMSVAAGTYTVTASRSGFFPASRTGLVVGTSGVTTSNVALVPAPILNVSGTAVNDGIGNNNGVVDFGECFTLGVTLVNTGTAGATGIVATLSSSSPGVVISQGVSAYPNLAAGGGTGANVTPFLLSSSPAATEAGKPIKLTLNLTTASGPLSIRFELATGGGGVPTVVAATGPVPIPDNSFVGAALSIPVAGFGQTLSKVKVAARISHTFNGDLILRLISPDNTIVTLAQNVGGSNPGFGTDCPADANDTTFDDAATTPIASGTGTFVGSFRPQEPLSTFGGKSGAQVNGNWQLKVIDLGPIDTGNIECVTLTLNGSTFGGCTGSDLSITKTDGMPHYTPGQVLNYTIVATNAGTISALGSPVTDSFPSSLTGVTWTCNASAGSSCAAANGSGNIGTTVDLLAGGSVTFLANATVSLSATGAIVNTATIARGDGRTDPIPGNDSATDINTPPGAYYTLTPCRLIDTRNAPGPLGGPALAAGMNRTFQVSGGCGIPANATAVFLNVTAVSPTDTGNLRIFPTGAPVPTVSALNYSAGQVRGNNGIYSLDASGRFDIRCAQGSGTANVVVDVAGYFVE